MPVKISGTSSEATPSFSGDDGDSGLHATGNQVQLVTQGTAAVTVDSAQQVGIGTTTPGALLEANGGNVRMVDTNGRIYLQNGNTANGAKIGVRGTSDATDGYLAFETNSIEFGRFDSSGNFSVGTGTGTNQATINGAASSTSVNKLIFHGGGTNNPSAAIEYDAGDKGLAFQVGNYSTLSSSEAGRFDTAGRLLVGTPTVYQASNIFPQFQVGGTTDQLATASIFNSANNATAPRLIFGKQRNGAVVANNDGLGGIWFSGRDNSPGDINVTSAKIEAFVDGTVSLNSVPTRLVFSTASGFTATERMRISSNGKYEFNPAGSGMYIYNFSQAAGNSTVKYDYNSGLLSFHTSSRLVKENIVDCPYGIEELKQLQPRKYVRIDSGQTEIGFIADEMHEVMPEFAPCGKKSIATKNEEDKEEIPLSVNYDVLTAFLTKALQEAIAKIEILEAKVAALESA